MHTIRFQPKHLVVTHLGLGIESVACVRLVASSSLPPSLISFLHPILPSSLTVGSRRRGARGVGAHRQNGDRARGCGGGSFYAVGTTGAPREFLLPCLEHRILWKVTHGTPFDWACCCDTRNGVQSVLLSPSTSRGAVTATYPVSEVCLAPPPVFLNDKFIFERSFHFNFLFLFKQHLPGTYI